MIKYFETIRDFLADYPPWVKIAAGSWVIITAFLIVVIICIPKRSSINSKQVQNNNKTGSTGQMPAMSGEIKPIYLTCEKCGNRFQAAAASPGIIMRIEAPCPACNHINKTPYGLVTPFFEELFYLAPYKYTLKIPRKTLLSKLGMNNNKINPDRDATVAEIMNAYLMWLDSAGQNISNVVALPGTVLYFLAPDASIKGAKVVLRKKLQDILSSDDIDTALSKLDKPKDNNSFAVLKRIVTILKDQGITLKSAIDILLKITLKK